MYKLDNLLCINSNISNVDCNKKYSVLKYELINLFYEILSLLGYKVDKIIDYEFSNFLISSDDKSIICTCTFTF